MKIYENIVIGGGASGLMFTANLKNKEDTIILEHNNKLGAKIRVSGGGRCNFTNKNISTSNYLASSAFLKGLLREFGSQFIFEYFTNLGLKSTLKDGTQYFCKSSSKELLDLLLYQIKGAKIALNCKVLDAKKDGNIFEVSTTRGKYKAKKLIITSGGLSFTNLGATAIGYEIAKSFGHKIIATKPALVGFTLQPQDSFLKTLSGVSINVKIKVDKKELEGSMLFAHKGISGPVVLNASLFWNRGHLEINFLPKFDLKSIKNSNKNISNLLPFPKRVALAFLEKLEIRDKKATLLSKEDWSKLEELKYYKLAPAGTFGYSKAEVTKGGIATNEIKNNFESKLVDNLYFLGEVLDVTGMLGGYNFNFAFLSAIKCARNN